MQPNVTQGQVTEVIILWVFTVGLPPLHSILLRYWGRQPRFLTHFSDGFTARSFLFLFFLAVVAAGVTVFFCTFAQEPAAVFHPFAGAHGALMFAWNRYMVVRSLLPCETILTDDRFTRLSSHILSVLTGQEPSRGFSSRPC